eukprot:gnl/MRDRNA2_/MRDRNA2_31412_c0_seq1.p1 gnl/MRDRNA2_/MRDRNA2_31412_c0~~gnl/MRDRNA2_/MRDRNA2_31412_c0_seq1.p1  ORF type:complete len:249 (+),score=35.10 gnl/MRDRNA2_/MRDRNA2_31412_c0_seq1:101-847(+)
MRGIGIALALGLGLCHSKVVCSSAKASGLPVQVAEPPSEGSEQTLLAKSRGNSIIASPERQPFLAQGRTSVDAFASADDSAGVKARNLLSRQLSDRPQGTVLLQRSRRPKGTLLLNGRQPPRRLSETVEALRDMPTWEDLPESEQVQEPVVEEEAKPPQVPFTPCVNSDGELEAFYGEDWQPENQDACREHCESFGSQACVGYSFHMTYGCKLFSPAKWQMGTSRKAKSIAIAGMVSCAASVNARPRM